MREKAIYHLVSTNIVDNKTLAQQIIKSNGAQIYEIINYTTKEEMCPIHDPAPFKKFINFQNYG